MVFELPPRESSWRGRESKRERVRVIGVFIMKMMHVSEHSPDAIKFSVGKWSCRSHGRRHRVLVLYLSEDE
jgi:hypothetical protein